MRIMLTYAGGPLDAARISDEAGFAKRNVNDVLADLVASRAVEARWSQNERLFLAYRDKWAALLEVGPSAEHMPAFVSWVHLLPASLEIIAWLERETGTTDSEYLISSRARDLIERVTPDLEMVGIAPAPGRPLPGAAYLSVLADTIYSLLAKMGVEHGERGSRDDQFGGARAGLVDGPGAGKRRY
jgi:hypothetical protein